MAKLSITIQTDNAAFEGDPSVELARILADYAASLERESLRDRKLYDINGNPVGRVLVSTR